MENVVAIVAWLVLLLGVGWSEGSVAHVSDSGTSLISALQNSSIDTIVIDDDYSIAGGKLSSTNGSVFISRNVTLTGKDGTNTFLDLDYQRGLVELCNTCTFTIHNITLVNDRKGKGILSFWSINDLFVAPSGGAKLVYNNTFMLRHGCSTIKDTSQIVSITKRSEAFPLSASGSRMQVFEIANATIRGVVYPDAIVGVDYSIDAPYAVQDASQGPPGPAGGYSMLVLNSARACRAVVSPNCTMTPDACVNALVDAALAAEAEAANKARNIKVVAAVVPVVAVVLICAAFGAFMWARKRRLRLQQAKQLSLKSSGGRARSPDQQSASNFSAMESGMLDRNFGSSLTERTGSMTHRPFGLHRGYSVIGKAVTPYVDVVDDPKLEFGELLGAGSFGRVYHGHWAGREAAIKVIQHTTETTEAVRSEVELMMLFNHPNVVRAYHYITYIRESNHKFSFNSRASSRTGLNGLGSGLSSGGVCGVISTPCSTADEASLAGSTVEEGTDEHEHDVEHNDDVIAAPCDQAAALAVPTLRISKAETWLVQEFCDAGTLNAVAAEWHPENEGDEQMLQRLLLLQDCARGLQALHDKKVVHGDLNARNVLVSTNPVAQFGLVAKLADLGLSRIVLQAKTHHSTNSMGTMSHMPPELLRFGTLSPAVDVYSFGVMMWELYTGQAAFRKLHYGQFFEAIVLQNLRPLIPTNMPVDYKLLMERCWATDPSDRPSVSRVLHCICVMIDERQARLQESFPPDSATARGATAGATAADVMRHNSGVSALLDAIQQRSTPLPMVTAGVRAPAYDAAAAAAVAQRGCFTAPLATCREAEAAGYIGSRDSDRYFTNNSFTIARPVPMPDTYLLTPTLPNPAMLHNQQQQQQLVEGSEALPAVATAPDGCSSSVAAAVANNSCQQSSQPAAVAAMISPFAQVAGNSAVLGAGQAAPEGPAAAAAAAAGASDRADTTASSSWARGLSESPLAQNSNWFV